MHGKARRTGNGDDGVKYLVRTLPRRNRLAEEEQQPVFDRLFWHSAGLSG